MDGSVESAAEGGPVPGPMNENASAWYGSVSVGASQIVDEHPMIKLLTMS
jgi:hypothetical protein